MKCQIAQKLNKIFVMDGTIERIEYIIGLLDSDVISDDILESLSNEIKELSEENKKSLS